MRHVCWLVQTARYASLLNYIISILKKTKSQWTLLERKIRNSPPLLLDTITLITHVLLLDIAQRSFNISSHFTLVSVAVDLEGILGKLGTKQRGFLNGTPSQTWRTCTETSLFFFFFFFNCTFKNCGFFPFLQKTSWIDETAIAWKFFLHCLSQWCLLVNATS